MICETQLAYSLKNIKLTPSKDQPLGIKPILHKLSSLPIVRKNIPNSKSLQTRLTVEGHKYFSKFVASGENTEIVMKALHKSKNFKKMHSFEFDPYFCETSCLRSLIKVMQRLKEIKKLNLIIRRVDVADEINCLNPILYKLHRLEKMRLEFPKTLKITEEGLLKFMKILGKCYSVKSFDNQFIEMQAYSAKCDWAFRGIQRRMINIEESKVYLTEGSARHEFDSRANFKPFRAKKIKTISTTINVPREWSYQHTTDQDHTIKDYIQFFISYPNLRRTDHKIIRHPLSLDDIVHSCTFLSHCPFLEHLSFESIKCRMSEIEFMAFACGVSKLKSIKRIIFKAIHNDMITGELIYQFFAHLSKNLNLENFEFAFRNFKRLNTTEEPIGPLIERLLAVENNMKCEYFKNSLYLTK